MFCQEVFNLFIQLFILSVRIGRFPKPFKWNSEQTRFVWDPSRSRFWPLTIILHMSLPMTEILGVIYYLIFKRQNLIVTIIGSSVYVSIKGVSLVLQFTFSVYHKLCESILNTANIWAERLDKVHSNPSFVSIPRRGFIAKCIAYGLVPVGLIGFWFGLLIQFQLHIPIPFYHPRTDNILINALASAIYAVLILLDLIPIGTIVFGFSSYAFAYVNALEQLKWTHGLSLTQLRKLQLIYRSHQLVQCILRFHTHADFIAGCLILTGCTFVGVGLYTVIRLRSILHVFVSGGVGVCTICITILLNYVCKVANHVSGHSGEFGPSVTRNFHDLPAYDKRFMKSIQPLKYKASFFFSSTNQNIRPVMGNHILNLTTQLLISFPIN